MTWTSQAALKNATVGTMLTRRRSRAATETYASGSVIWRSRAPALAGSVCDRDTARASTRRRTIEAIVFADTTPALFQSVDRHVTAARTIVAKTAAPTKNDRRRRRVCRTKR